ncbi:hypothetical protein BTO19_24025 [Vibrio parahaemolyticus]|uniref:hypothetical protein n=1 Tax=Vibrio harveyi group TaxID=717610 RepID=UPI000A38AEF8|nr:MULTISPECIES: hypothetical protein [Vibrio harveyi group]MDG2809736.1 hypothetical protein [Vibrio parahaemolyticus]OUJ22805.1 hypothetical protein BTO19_24025 [Vibrio parahaemolyticus]HBC3530924.1 hypothetical protein [Vibrio parahaemolyticus]HCE4781638.1 hypothetical protein [Vibrio parahaemolyticus]
MSDDKKIEFSQSDVLNALLHQRGFEGNREQHFATQESVDNLKESVREFKANTNQRFEQVDKRFEQVDKRFDKLESKLDRLHWLIISLSLTLFFKEQILSLFMQ